MNSLYKLFEKRFCKHEKSITITNLYGDYIETNSFGKIYRSKRKCLLCGKEYLSEDLDPNCEVVNYYDKSEI